MEGQALKKILRVIGNEEKDSIRKEVAKEILKQTNCIQFFGNLLQYEGRGLKVNCMINSHAFFDKYYNEIEALRQLYEAENGEPVPIE
ncbi:hypothetical protein [Chryseobacterium oryctis]|uniref:Uncharacterized protein n=1 Tax=Chryseobacterium oryctis TaxID=2952618 RepID=A0ABT3HIS2_9FLAO|nr:hypothetical protein [Chryseobacterium oryctis]MCW3159678.1 hypothetical protein [Chryseobacterium oryctis]